MSVMGSLDSLTRCINLFVCDNFGLAITLLPMNQDSFEENSGFFCLIPICVIICPIAIA